MAKKPYHHGDLKKALIKGALEILDEESKLSLRTVSTRVGVSHNAAYRHFDDLEDLLGEVAAATFREIAVLLENSHAEDAPLEERLRAGVRTYLDYGLSHPGRYALLFSQQFPIFEHDSAREAAEFAFGTVVRQADDAGAPMPHHTAFLVLSMLHGTIELLKRDAIPSGLDSSRDTLVQQTIDEATEVVLRFTRGADS